ncbi:MAG: DUF3280 domain-containing protein [Flavobacteriales bacterium]|nr:DUF3280 domain-containing protein [Flavobacteriales bacterium]
MKSLKSKFQLPFKRLMANVVIKILFASTVIAQNPTLAILDFETSGLIDESKSVSDLVRIEMEKTKKYQVLNYYDLKNALQYQKINVEDCKSPGCLLKLGASVDADYVMSGAAQRFGEKIIITLRLHNVKSKEIEATSVMEFLNLQPELQKMIQLSVEDLTGISSNEQIKDLLIYYDQPIESPNTRLNLNGPRMGVAVATGDLADVFQRDKAEGGYDMLPFMSQLGYQWEKQYLSAGDFQALFEAVPLISGLDQGVFIPSLTLMNGFRLNDSGWEVAFGPSISVSSYADGFYDSEGLFGKNDKWYLKKDWEELAIERGLINEDGSALENRYNIHNKMDSRGDLQITSKWIWAVGKTFKSGHLNIPVNAYVSPRKEGWLVGMSVGFNVAKK